MDVVTVMGLASDQDDVGRLHRYVRSHTDRYSHVRLRQRRRVVDPVSRHGDGKVPRLHLLHPFCLILRKDFGKILVDADLVGDPLRNVPVVACQHDARDPHFLQHRDFCL
jgi:hypothetical protein